MIFVGLLRVPHDNLVLCAMVHGHSYSSHDDTRKIPQNSISVPRTVERKQLCFQLCNWNGEALFRNLLAGRKISKVCALLVSHNLPFLCSRRGEVYARGAPRRRPKCNRHAASTANALRNPGFLRKLHKYVCGDRVRPQPLSTLIRRVLQPT